MAQESLVLLVVFVLVAAVGTFLYYRQHGGKGAASTAVPPPPPPPPPPPITEAEKQKRLAACQARGLSGFGTCTFDPTTNEYKLTCHGGRYGANCAETCRTGGLRKTVYTGGFEGTGTGAATCECPSQYHFKNSSVRSGCSSGTEQGSACVAGYHGPNCDLAGDFVNCGGNGTQNATTGKCDCRDGFLGEHCQYSPTYCTSKDKGAKLDHTTFECTCSEGWSGATCRTVADGYIVKDGKATPWKDVWTDMSDAEVVFQGAGRTSDWGKESCGNSNNCTQKVGICSLLQTNNGCNSLNSLCTNSQVGFADGRCSLLEAGAGGSTGAKIASVVAGTGAVVGATAAVVGTGGALAAAGGAAGAAVATAAGTAAASTVGAIGVGGTAAVATGAAVGAGAATASTGIFDIQGQNPWFESMTVPENISYGVWDGNDCSGTERRAMGPCNDTSCTFNSGTYQDWLAFKFKLAPGTYAKCGSTYYMGQTTAQTGSAPVSEVGSTFKMT